MNSGNSYRCQEALTRWSENLAIWDNIIYKIQTVMLKLHNLKEGVYKREDTKSLKSKDFWTDNSPDQHWNPLDEHLQKSDNTDTWWEEVLQVLYYEVRHCRKISFSNCHHFKGKLQSRGCLYVSHSLLLKIFLLQLYHETLVTGHPANSNKLELLRRHYFWLGMRKNVEQVVRKCHFCHWICTSRHVLFGILMLLPIPQW